jgi:hypothetical protein
VVEIALVHLPPLQDMRLGRPLQAKEEPAGRRRSVAVCATMTVVATSRSATLAPRLVCVSASGTGVTAWVTRPVAPHTLVLVLFPALLVVVLALPRMLVLPLKMVAVAVVVALLLHVLVVPRRRRPLCLALLLLTLAPPLRLPQRTRVRTAQLQLRTRGWEAMTATRAVCLPSRQA